LLSPLLSPGAAYIVRLCDTLDSLELAFDRLARVCGETGHADVPYRGLSARRQSLMLIERYASNLTPAICDICPDSIY
jgi:hypothetical protein